LAARILGSLKQNISAFTLIPSSGGKFELVVDGETLYSKLQTGTFPDEGDIVSQLQQR
jgi:selenoprotein W-related protein